MRVVIRARKSSGEIRILGSRGNVVAQDADTLRSVKDGLPGLVVDPPSQYPGSQFEPCSELSSDPGGAVLVDKVSMRVSIAHQRRELAARHRNRFRCPSLAANKTGIDQVSVAIEFGNRPKTEVGDVEVSVAVKGAARRIGATGGVVEYLNHRASWG